MTEFIETILTVGSTLAALGGSLYLLHWYQTRTDKKLSDREAIKLARQNGGEISSAYLTLHTNLSDLEANTKIQRLMARGVIYHSTNEKHRSVLRLNEDFLKGELPPPTEEEKVAKLEQTKAYTDADIISLAIETKGEISAAALCVKTKLPIEKAEELLQGLHEKGVFDVRVNENGTILYVLNDKTLLG